MAKIPLVVGPNHGAHCPAIEIQEGEPVRAFDRPERIDRIVAALRNEGGFVEIGPSVAAEPELERVHRREMIVALRMLSGLARKRGRDLFADTFWHRSLRPDGSPPPGQHLEGLMGRYCFDTITCVQPSTFGAALESASVALTATNAVIEGAPVAWALCRPPGHHAAPEVFGGGTFFNNTALAARRLAERGGVAVLDLDFHHGNGTELVFYEDPDVLTVSLHGSPAEHFPFFRGFESDRGSGAGLGSNLNLPLAAGFGIGAYLGRLEEAVAAIRSHRSDHLVVALGFDTHRDDPAGTGMLTAPDFELIGHAVGALGLPTTVVLEGGYVLDALGACAVRWHRGFAGARSGN